MKKEIFKSVLEAVLEMFELTRDEFFSKTKKREIVDARQMLFYICRERPMEVVYIKKFMEEFGLKVESNTVNNGIERVRNRIHEDDDYYIVSKRINDQVTI